MASIITIDGLTKRYASGFEALKGVDLTIEEGEIFALLGPNGAGKTTMISIICGIARATGGSVTVAGHDIVRDYRGARSAIGLVPQELSTDQFERVIDTVTFSRGLFGKPRNPAHIEKVLRDLSLWDKRNSKILELSGGMKRRVMIAKALSHEPDILFLDEPTAGVDVELRRDMWAMVRKLRERGVTARGVDVNHEMVEVCRARGFDVAEGDALGYLEALPDGALGGLFAAQVVEHLSMLVDERAVEEIQNALRFLKGA